jgi:hypothetical protein
MARGKVRTLRLDKHMRQIIDFLYQYPKGKKIAEDFLREYGIIEKDEILYQFVHVMGEGNDSYSGYPAKYTAKRL